MKFSDIIFISRQFFVWEFPFKSLAKVSFASAVMGTVVYPIGNSLTSSVLINLILSIFIGIIVYTAMLFVLREPNKKEIQVLQKARLKLFKVGKVL